MAPPPPMVRYDFVEPENFSVFFRHKTGDPFPEPVVECVLVAGGFLEVVGVTALDHFPKNGQHFFKIGLSGFSNFHDLNI